MKRFQRMSFFALATLALIWTLGPPGLDAVQGRPPPKVIRPACTDNVCGGCDGLCHDPEGREYDHLTVRKNGHCSCTPRKGGELDAAIREAYDRWAAGR
ncbi:MAG: hypothetical protein ACE5JI_22870 [Acidobacteriota bacterium]